MLGQFPNCFRLIGLKERGIYIRIALFCIVAERTKHIHICIVYVLYIHVQCSFRFLAERHKTLAKRLVGKTAGHLSNILPQLRPVQGGEGV